MTIDLYSTYLLLEHDGEAVELPVTEDFWAQLMSGNPSDPKIRRLAASDGRMLAGYTMESDWDHWEMHPAGDEILMLQSGRMTLLIEEDDGVREVEFMPGQTCIVPAGAWHTARVPEPSRLLAITPGKGTDHRPL